MADTLLDKLRSEALKLSNAERAQLAHELVCSLGGPTEALAHDAWDDEILQRIDQIDAGAATMLDREEFRKKAGLRLRTQ